MTEQPVVMPAFVFYRLRHIELEAGFILAGQLIVDIPKTKRLNGRRQRVVQRIIQRLTTEAQSGCLPKDGLIFGWHDDVRPPNAVDTRDDKIMGAWAAGSVSIGVRIDPRNDGVMRTDSDMLRQMGFRKHDA